jgi:gamma-glutamylcyclotransferase (GGCT)/AIG2-like uncharacterized protein YtfP
MTAPVLLFVYGTLRRGSGHLMAERLASAATYVGDASVNGALYDTGTFPACLPPEGPADRVHGDVWALQPAAAAELLALLDRYEGYAPDDRYDSLFVRVRVQVEFGDGSVQEAWMYRYNEVAQALTRISSGDWLNP